MVTDDFGVEEFNTTLWVVPVNIAAQLVNPNVATNEATGTNKRSMVFFI